MNNYWLMELTDGDEPAKILGKLLGEYLDSDAPKYLDFVKALDMFDESFARPGEWVKFNSDMSLTRGWTPTPDLPVRELDGRKYWLIKRPSEQ